MYFLTLHGIKLDVRESPFLSAVIQYNKALQTRSVRITLGRKKMYRIPWLCSFGSVNQNRKHYNLPVENCLHSMTITMNSHVLPFWKASPLLTFCLFSLSNTPLSPLFQGFQQAGSADGWVTCRSKLRRQRRGARIPRRIAIAHHVAYLVNLIPRNSF